jgi:acyl carrier protein
MDVRESVSAFICSEFDAALGGQAPGADATLIESGIVDSLGIMKLLQYLEDEFSIRIGDDELRPENFETLGRIVSLVEQKLAAH